VRIVHSIHWAERHHERNEITDDLIEHALVHSPILNDRRHEGVLIAISRVPPSGRLLKVAYRKLKTQEIKVLTAYWLD